MADIDDIRRFLRGEEVEGVVAEAPPSKPAKRRERRPVEGAAPSTVDLEKMSSRGARYTVSMDGTDATLHFGRHKGKTLSVMVNDKDGRDYMRWMLKQDFPKELSQLVQYVLEEALGLGETDPLRETDDVFEDPEDY